MKLLTDELPKLDVRELHRTDMLEPGALFFTWHQGVGCVTGDVQPECVTLRHGGMTTPVLLDWTQCALGGRRVWWRCPAAGCGRRVALLFLRGAVACRQCHKLAYRSQRLNSDDRAINKAGQIRRQLGWMPGIANPAGCKPSGMRWTTYWRLRAKHDHLACVGLQGELNRLRGHLNRS